MIPLLATLIIFSGLVLLARKQQYLDKRSGARPQDESFIRWLIKSSNGNEWIIFIIFLLFVGFLVLSSVSWRIMHAPW